jgi:cytochrome c oxidase assembly protein subunit 15
MSKNVSAPQTAPLTVFRLAALFTFLAVAMGSVVAATKSGASCPTWPGCRPHQLTPQWQLSPVIEFTHRVVAMAAGPLVLAAGVMSGRLTRPNLWVRILPWVALVGALASGAFGRLVVVSTLPTWLGGVDLFCALMAMTVMAIAAVVAGRPAPEPAADPAANPAAAAAAHSDHPRERTTQLAASSIIVLIAMHVTGIFVASKGSFSACLGWPLWRMIDSDLYPPLQVVRLCLAGLGAALVVATAVVAARSERLRPWGITLAALFAAEMVLGLLIRAQGINNGVASAYCVLAAALLWCLGLLSAVSGTAEVAIDGEHAPPASARGELAQPGRR